MAPFGKRGADRTRMLRPAASEPTAASTRTDAPAFVLRRYTLPPGRYSTRTPCFPTVFSVP